MSIEIRFFGLLRNIIGKKVIENENIAKNSITTEKKENVETNNKLKSNASLESYKIKGRTKNINIGDSLMIHSNWEGEPVILYTKKESKIIHINF